MSGQVFYKELIAPCGMVCAYCAGHLTYRETAGRRGCSGCRTRHKTCAFLKGHCQLLSNRLVEYCYECVQFPCERLLKLERRYAKKRYANSFIYNLEFMRSEDIQGLIEEKVRAFTCQSCGKDLSIHSDLCPTCGARDESRERFKWAT